MWFGLWDNERNVRGLPYLLKSWWRGPRRIKQYEAAPGRVGGHTLDIDSDWVYGLFTGNKRAPDLRRICDLGSARFLQHGLDSEQTGGLWRVQGEPGLETRRLSSSPDRGETMIRNRRETLTATALVRP